ncbi:MAG: D-sedoheptulose 7-phosphate isomerase [Bacilli bacterium]|nr:D-sedoheptulose 7-phosphate isomerase [Bacilli bacterium]
MDKIDLVLNEQINNLNELKNNNYKNKIMEISNLIINAMKNGNKILIAGNGGSAADAQHFAAELVGRFCLERKGLPAIALTTDSSILTCMGNDYGYDFVFSRQIEALGKAGDIFIGISTSGNSKNIINATLEANKNGIISISMTGKDGGIIKEISDFNLNFNYKETARVQEHHIMSIHLICEAVEKKMKIFQEG